MKTGAVHITWTDDGLLADRLDELLSALPDTSDRRGALGKERGGRMKAADIAERVRGLALQIM
jgi:malonate decarboxylase gamma subunit